MIKRGVAGLLALLLLANQAALAQQQAGGAQRNRYCFNKKEAEAESEVRTGLILRETLRRCARFDPTAGQEALDAWYLFDRDNADKFTGSVALRGTAIKRIYPKRTVQEQWENDASIAVRAAPEVDAAVCKSAYDMVDKIKTEGWPGFKYYAKLQQSLLVHEIPVCRSP
jgi:hypothetical protein